MGEAKFWTTSQKGKSKATDSSATNRRAAADNAKNGQTAERAALLLIKLSLDEGTTTDNPSLADLDPDDGILLLTPYLHLPPTAASGPMTAEEPHMDPFEPFGRLLCRFHNRIRHMPYVAKRGLIDAHREMIDEARGVLVVICDSSASAAYDRGRRQDLVQDQEAFARQVGDTLAVQGKPCGLVVVSLESAGKTHFGSRVDVKSWKELEASAGLVFADQGGLR